MDPFGRDVHSTVLELGYFVAHGAYDVDFGTSRDSDRRVDTIPFIIASNTGPADVEIHLDAINLGRDHR